MDDDGLAAKLLQVNRWFLLAIWVALSGWFTYCLIEAVWLSATSWAHDRVRAAWLILIVAVFAIVSVRVGWQVLRRSPLRGIETVGVVVLALYFLTFEALGVTHHTPWWVEFAIIAAIVGTIDTSIGLWPRRSAE